MSNEKHPLEMEEESTVLNFTEDDNIDEEKNPFEESTNEDTDDDIIEDINEDTNENINKEDQSSVRSTINTKPALILQFDDEDNVSFWDRMPNKGVALEALKKDDNYKGKCVVAVITDIVNIKTVRSLETLEDINE